MRTATATKSISATKLTVATLALIAAGGAALATLPLNNSGSSVINVNNCQTLAEGDNVVGIKTVRSGKTTELKNKCNGTRFLTYTCLSATQYKVEWTPCSSGSLTSTTSTVTETLSITTTDNAMLMVPGSGQKIASFKLTAIGGKDIALSAINPQFVTYELATSTFTITNWKLQVGGESTWYPGNSMSYDINGQALQFPFVYTLAVGTSKTIDIYADIIPGGKPPAQGGTPIALGFDKFGNGGQVLPNSIDVKNTPVFVTKLIQ